MSILLHVMAQGVESHTTAAIIADLDYIQKFHFVPMSQSELGYEKPPEWRCSQSSRWTRGRGGLSW